MELQTIKSAGLRELAQKFRTRAAEGDPGLYRDLMLQTAAELEEFAESMEKKGGTELVLVDDDKESNVA